MSISDSIESSARRYGSMWASFANQASVDEIMNDKGLAKLGDALVNLCYSLAKSLATDALTGEKVRDDVLAKALRSTPVYRHLRRRTDIGTAGDAYEAIIAYLWLSGQTSIEEVAAFLSQRLEIDKKTSRKREADTASEAFQALLEHLIPKLTSTLSLNT
ncbi:MAG: ribonuclease III family protein [Candidatus Thorarchaeota archaeon]